MAVEPLSIGRIEKTGLYIVIGCLIIVITLILSFPNYTKLKMIKEENARLIAEKERLEKEIADYESKIKSGMKDPYLYEKIARDDLGVAKENEIVIDIEQ